MQTLNFLSQQCPSAVSFIGVPSCYTNWINSSYSFSISTIRTVSQRFSVSYLHDWIQTDHVSAHVLVPFEVTGDERWHDTRLKKKTKSASAKYMVSRFTGKLEQMIHQSIPQVFKSILAHRHSVSCLICVVHLNRHVRNYVMWRVCLLKCASLIMVFPSISESSRSPPLTPMKTLPLWGGMFYH